MVTDKDDHIWKVYNRPRDINPDESRGAATTPPRTDCCIAAPAVLEFDTAGNLIKGWGGPGYVPDWPAEGIERPGAGAEPRRFLWIGRETFGWEEAPGETASKNLQEMGSCFGTSGIVTGPRTPPGQQLGASEADQPGHRYFSGRDFFL